MGYGINAAAIIKLGERGTPLKVIICRPSVYHVPVPDLNVHGVDFCCIVELLQPNFLQHAIEQGVFYHIDTKKALDDHERILTSLNYNYYGVVFAFAGSVDEFLIRFSVIDMSGNVKRCPICKDCFVALPSELYRHILKHVAEEKKRFRKESFRYYLGPD